jgi:hypothetical protein
MKSTDTPLPAALSAVEALDYREVEQAGERALGRREGAVHGVVERDDLTCSRDMASCEKSSPKLALNMRTL